MSSSRRISQDGEDGTNIQVVRVPPMATGMQQELDIGPCFQKRKYKGRDTNSFPASLGPEGNNEEKATTVPLSERTHDKDGEDKAEVKRGNDGSLGQEKVSTSSSES